MKLHKSIVKIEVKNKRLKLAKLFNRMKVAIKKSHVHLQYLKIAKQHKKKAKIAKLVNNETKFAK